MNLYLITRTDGGGDYDEYDSAVVAANNPEEAILQLPDYPEDWCNYEWYKRVGKEIPKLNVKYICVAAPDVEEPQCIVASFNAG